MINYVKTLFNIREQKKQMLLIILVCFLATFALAHLWSLYVGDQGSVFYHGFHIHHFYFGMMVLTAGALLAALSDSFRYKRVASGMIGVGMGLFADEIGLLLNCTSANRACLYTFPDEFDIIGNIAVAIVLVIILVDFLERRWQWQQRAAQGVSEKEFDNDDEE